MLLADVVATSEAIAATRARSVKVEALAGLLARVEPDEIEPVVGFLSGEVRQGRIGIGWATVASVDATPSETASLTVADVDAALDGAGHDRRARARPSVVPGCCDRCSSGRPRRRVASSAGCSPASCARAPSKG